ncbi:hypothetical protein KQX54_005578 [Cotesia glomerata]|uniref:Uncharacterized protein n=1 Tax=Cotesia glomerata TaxID=32391 RepID=A0AAV7HRC0_COTGL|nr:hypothetical protein KQX54_005578 [Cotesia glomerata]
MSRKCDYDESVNYEKNTKKTLAKTFETKSVEIRLKDRTYHRRRVALGRLPQIFQTMALRWCKGHYWQHGIPSNTPSELEQVNFRALPKLDTLTQPIKLSVPVISTPNTPFSRYRSYAISTERY